MQNTPKYTKTHFPHGEHPNANAKASVHANINEMCLFFGCENEMHLDNMHVSVLLERLLQCDEWFAW